MKSLQSWMFGKGERRAVEPSGSKYPTFKVSDPTSLLKRYGFWNQNPQVLGYWVFGSSGEAPGSWVGRMK